MMRRCLAIWAVTIGAPVWAQSDAPATAGEAAAEGGASDAPATAGEAAKGGVSDAGAGDDPGTRRLRRR